MRYYVIMYKKAGLLIILLITFLTLPSADAWSLGRNGNGTSGFFIYHIPEDSDKTPETDGKTAKEEEKTDSAADTQNVPKDIVSDDVTADTSSAAAENNANTEDDITEDASEESVFEEYRLSDMYSNVLHGYASYDEEDENDDVISLEDTLDVYQAIKIKTPAKIGSKKYTAGITSSQSLYSTLNTTEYSIAPISGTSYAKKNGFSAGTMYNQGIDYAELEQTTGVFSRYETKYFAVSTAYAKTVNTTNNNYNDNFYLAPELKISQYFSLKEVFSTDITKNRKKIETILSINPFGNKDKDRLIFELGTSSTYDENNALLKNQFKFSTNFKL